MAATHAVTATMSPNHGTEIVDEVCTSWKFDNTDFNDTLTSEFELVCENAYLRPTFQMTYMVGNMLGAPLSGFLADKYGRHPVLLGGVITLTLMTFLSSILTNFNAILFTRFMIGAAHPAIICCGYIMCMEVTAPKLRAKVGLLIGVPWAVGTMCYGLAGFYIRDWRWLQRATVAAAVLVLPLPLMAINESPRWLIVKGNYRKALKILKLAYKRNKVTQPKDEFLLLKMREIHRNAELLANKTSDVLGGTKVHDELSILDRLKKAFRGATLIFSGPEIRRRSFLIFCIFLTNSTVFYGLSLNAINYGVNPYLYMAIGGVMEIPAYVCTVPIVDKFGRIPPTTAFFFICGATILVLTLIPSDITWLVMVLAMVGKLCITAAYQVSYLIVSEVFPTEVRLQGLGAANFISRIGSIAAPFMTDALDGPLLKWMPSVIFGSMSLLAAIACWFIPETMRAHLPDTIMQLEEQTRRGKKLKEEAENVEDDEEIEDVEVELKRRLTIGDIEPELLKGIEGALIN